ncbi:MAG: hypothetical protein AB8F95_08740 [Bacteroidia bacterium]
MQNFQLSEAKKNQLAATIAKRLMSEAQEVHSVNGDHLQRYTSFPQVNQFLLFQVYQVWQLQIARFRHSYFDFDHPEVENQLQVLQNLLSRHIHIAPADMEPLLRNAVYNTLSLLCEPEENLKSFFFSQKESIPLSRYETLVPFFHDFDFAVHSILRYHEKQSLETLDRDVFAVKLDKVFELYEGRGNSIADYRQARLEALTGKTLNALKQEDDEARKAREVAQAELSAAAEAQAKLEAEKARKAADAEAEARRIEEAARQQAQAAEALRRQTSFFDGLTASAPVIDLETPPGANEPLEVPEPPKPEPKPEPKAKAPAKTKNVSQKAPKKETIADKLAATRDTVADKLRETKGTVADTFVQKPESVMDKLGSKEDEPIVSAPVEIELPEPKEVAVPEPKVVEAAAEKVKEAKAEVKEVTEDLGSEGLSVLEKLRKKPEPKAEEVVAEKPKTVADRFKKDTPAKSAPASSGPGKEIVPDEIPVHKQYQFVQKVFGGNHARFRAIIEKVNHAENAGEVNEVLEKYVLNTQQVKGGDPVVDEFASLMRSRY